MKFTDISSVAHCDCLNDAVENTTDLFARKVNKSPNLRIQDFRNQIEKGRIPVNESDCEEVCGLRGVSVDIWTEESQGTIMQKYQNTLKFSPKAKNNVCVVKFAKDSCLLKYTPYQKPDYNPYHYDLFKEDSFSEESMEVVTMVPITL